MLSLFSLLSRNDELKINNFVQLPYLSISSLYFVREFEVPWFSLDKRELIERKGKVKPGRSRGKPRGRTKGYS